MPRWWEEGHKDELVPKTETALLGGTFAGGTAGCRAGAGRAAPRCDVSG